MTMIEDVVVRTTRQKQAPGTSVKMHQSTGLIFALLLGLGLLSTPCTAVEISQCGTSTTWCPASRPCCEREYSPTGYGCESTPVLRLESSAETTSTHSTERLLQDPSSPLAPDTSCCKPGPALPPALDMPNCLILGDSVSIGYTPTVVELLKGNTSKTVQCQVQHAPYDLRDGGAESTSIALPCLDNFLVTQNQTAVAWDVIVFNFGLHNLEDQDASSQAVYRKQLYDIGTRLLQPILQDTNNSALKPPTLIYATTTPFMPYANRGIPVVDDLNTIARTVMKDLEWNFVTTIPIVDLNGLVHEHCGAGRYESCDWCRKDPCSYHYNANGSRAQGVAVAAAIEQVLLQR